MPGGVEVLERETTARAVECNSRARVASSARLRVVVRGAVRGVGFRPFIYSLAASLRLRGWVNNSSQGVFVEVEGREENPFALMFPALDLVEAACEVSEPQERLLLSPESPIVLLRRRKTEGEPDISNLNFEIPNYRPQVSS